MELIKVSNFSDKKPGFLKIIEVCLNLGIGFYITWLVLLNSDLPSLTVLTKSHSLTARHKILMVNWYPRKKFSLVPIHRFFDVFENKNNSNWSLIVLLMQIKKFQINDWFFLGRLSCIGCWFPCIILKLVDFSVHQKEEIAFLVSLCN